MYGFMEAMHARAPEKRDAADVIMRAD